MAGWNPRCPNLMRLILFKSINAFPPIDLLDLMVARLKLDDQLLSTDIPGSTVPLFDFSEETVDENFLLYAQEYY